jgi:class 3 adenylate cyclase
MSRIHDDEGDFMGAMFTAFMGVKASLVTLLALGDQSMYERMAKLVDPRRRQAAVLFCDLESSAVLSRQLPTVQYFKLIRQFSTCVDEVIGRHKGIIGKHAGDGASALFLIDDLGTASGAAHAAIKAARDLQQRVEELDVTMSADVGHCVLNVGLHWGGGLYMGQLVPGGRLDVTALGDEVNECARIQETARNGSLIASKGLIEQLTEEDAADLGIDTEKLTYKQLTELPDASEKAKRDAGGLPVTAL